MAKSYQGSLTLDWYNKEKAIILQAPEAKKESDIPAPRLNWVNKEESLFYEISDEEGRGLEPFWVDRNDIRVKEIRPLIFQKGFKAVAADKPGMLPGTEQTFKLEEFKKEDSSIPNMLIRGDNLLALNALVKMFAGKPDEEKVKCICIDPPYNTGSAFEQYDDNLEHSEWLTLVRDRLALCREILRDDGSLWITLDDNESHYFKVLCDDVFGRKNFIANVVWQKKYSKQNDAKWLSISHDHILVYGKNKEIWRPNPETRSEEQLRGYSNPDNDPRGLWQSVVYTCAKTRSERPNLYYAITHPQTKNKIFPNENRVWGYDQAKHSQHVLEKRLWWGQNDEKEKPRLKVFLNDVGTGIVPDTLWLRQDSGDNQDAKREAITLNETEVFTTPKPEQLFQRVLHIATNPGDLVLDCFAGSGTTLAVAQKMGRRYIGVEIGKHADTHIIPRLQKVLSGEDQGGVSEAQNWKGGGAFQYYHVGPSIIDNKKNDFNWQLGVDKLQESLLLTYDFGEFSKVESALLGIMRGKAETMAAVCSLAEPGKGNEIMPYFEFRELVNAARKMKPRSVVLFTNRGVEVAEQEKPDDIEIVKVPQAIFSELEK